VAAGTVLPPDVWVDDPDHDDPVLRQPDGTIVDTWREDYPTPSACTGMLMSMPSGCCR
jgi:hypothetical protein